MSGAFPLNPAGAFPVSLAGGSYIYPPAGNYFLTGGDQTVVQWWDPIASQWRNYCCPPAVTFQLDMDGYNQRIINMSGVVQAASITNVGSGGVNGIGPTQTGTTVAFAAPGGNGQTAKGYVIIGGAVGTAGGTATVTQGGSGFAVPPTIIIDPPPVGGIQATAVAAITTAGVLTSVTMVNPGAGYLTVPNFYAVPQFLDYPGQPALPYTLPTSPTPVAPNFPPGQIAGGTGPAGTGGILPPQMWMQALTLASPLTSGALITGPAITGTGTLTGIVVTDFGSLYTTSVPAVSFAGGTLAGGVAATAIMAWAAQSVSTFTGGTIAAVSSAISGLGQLALFNNNNLLLGRPIRGSVSTGGVVTVNDPGFAIQTLMATGSIGVIGAGVSVNPTGGGAGVMGPVNDTFQLQMFMPS
jgi:hypothetical protein